MPAPAKKSKAKKLGDLEKISEYKKHYKNVYFIENSSIPNAHLQALRTGVDGKVLFVKRGMFERAYPSVKIQGSFFLVFSNSDLREFIEAFCYPDFLGGGEVSPQEVVVPKGVLRKERLSKLLPGTVAQGTNAVLPEDYLVCREGEKIDEKQAEILRVLGEKLGESHCKILEIKNTSEL